MSAVGRFPRKFVDDCNDNDVIFGRGKGSYNNPGNKHLQHVIRQHFPQYDVADLQTKNVLAHKVVDVMLTKKPPSRFLKTDKETNRWYAMAREEVVKKIKQDFANLKSAHKRQIEDDQMPVQDRKRQAKATVAPSTLLEICNHDGCEEEVQSEMSAIVAVVNQVFVHHPMLDHQQQAAMILGTDAVKDAIVSILEWKSAHHANLRPGLKGKIPQPTAVPNTPRSLAAFCSNTPLVMPYAKRLPKKTTTQQLVKTNPTHMEKVCDSVHFEPQMDDVNKICRKLRVKDDRTYTGSVMNSNPHGIGFMKFDDGRIYCGGWQKGKLHGNACVLYKNGDKFLGEYVKNKRTGQGVCYYSDGSIYQGEFKNDKLNGNGAYQSRVGDVYDGEFVNGIFEGVGVHRKPDGTGKHGRFSNWKYIAPADGGEEGTLSHGDNDSSTNSSHGSESPGSNTSDDTRNDDDEQEQAHNQEDNHSDKEDQKNEKAKSSAEKPAPDKSRNKANENADSHGDSTEEDESQETTKEKNTECIMDDDHKSKNEDDIIL